MRLDDYIRSLGTFREWALLVEFPHVSPICASRKSRILIKMSVEHWLNETDREKPKTWSANTKTNYIYIYMKVQTVPHSKHAPSLLRLMLYREMMVWLPANHTKPINTVCGQKVEFLNVKAGST